MTIPGGNNEPPDDGSGSPPDGDFPYIAPSGNAPKKRKKNKRPAIEQNTDAGNAEQFAYLHAGHLRYVADTQRWIIWDESRWTDAVDGDLIRAAKVTAQALLQYAVQVEGDDAQKAAIAWALGSANLRRIKAMIEIASAEDNIEIRAADLDADPFLLNVTNGTVDLRKGTLRPHDRADFITKLVPITYDPEATCPRWNQFLEEIFAKDTDLIAFVQRAVGYSLSGDTREHALFLLWGTGCNGKSVFVEVLRALLGNFSVTAPISTFTAKRDNGGPTNDLAMLRGARIVTVQESDQGARFSEAIVKSLTGGDAITARFLNKEFFTFMPAFKAWIATNYKPKVKGTDDGFWRRVRLIPFLVSFLDRQDKELVTTLRAELPGILNWAIDGCIGWLTSGLGMAKAVTEATNEYRSESDSVADFMADCLLVNSDASITSKRLYEIYTKWCDVNADKPLSKKVLNQNLIQRPGISAYRDKFERGLQGVGELEVTRGAGDAS